MDNLSYSSKNNPILPVQSKLKSLFSFYCQNGNKLNTEILRSPQFCKMLQESRLITNQADKIKVEIIFKSDNKLNKMNYEEFLNSLVKLTKWKFKPYLDLGQMNLTKALNTLIHTYLLPRYEEIFNKPSIHDESGISGLSQSLRSFKNQPKVVKVPYVDEIIFDFKIVEVFQSVATVLFDVYKVYFVHETSMSRDVSYIKNMSFKNYFIFIKDFDLYPGIVTKQAAFHIYRSEEEENVTQIITRDRDHYLNLVKNVDLSSVIKYNQNGNILGRFFNYFKFLRVILKISEWGYEKYNSLEEDLIESKSITSFEKLILCLERMELSEGFLNIEKKTNKTHSKKTSIMITPSLLSLMSEEDNLSKLVNSKISKGSIDKLLGKNYKDSCQYTDSINATYGNELLYIFKGFCSFGDPLNTQFMRSHIFQKVLKEAGLLSPGLNSNTNQHSLKVTEIDSIFIKLSGENSLDQENPQIRSATTIHNYNSNTRADETGDNTHRIKIHSGAKINFGQFLIAIEIIAKLVFPSINTEQAIDLVIRENLLKNLYEYIEKLKNLEMKIEYLRETQKNSEEVNYILSLIHKSFFMIFSHYSKDKLLDFNQLVK
jgi:hypothetical protein